MAVNWIQAREILDEALQIPVEDRSPYLDNACPDPEVRRYVESLIISYDKATEFLEQPAVTLLAEPWREAESPQPWIGRRIGSYLIEKEIGEGGMGTVFQAVRADDEYQKCVAIKLVKSGFASSFAIARFKAERQILASLEHPNIARLLDGGRTEEGYPYLVMEFVDGVPIDEYCDAHRLTIDQRLQLFRAACDAVQFAHQNLIIHRDLKPGNILVTKDGVPKLLDFGIAKLLNPEFVQTPLVTRTEWRPMTLEYASPEQVRGQSVTEASDIYSLGVLLYELLAGRRPYDTAGRSRLEIERMICEQEPERPSLALSGTLARRALDGDLDTIIMKALRKEPRLRYKSVAEFAEDIQNHLSGLPVRARNPTVTYRTRTFVRRHKESFATAS